MVGLVQGQAVQGPQGGPPMALRTFQSHPARHVAADVDVRENVVTFEPGIRMVSLAVEAAQILARSPSPIATTFYRVRRKRGYNVAVTALARKLIVLVWYMLQNGEPYRYASVESTRRKLRSLITAFTGLDDL